MMRTPRHHAAAVDVDQCGVWSAWVAGSPVDKIRLSRRSGLVVDVHVPPAAQRSACSMSAVSSPNSRVVDGKRGANNIK